MLKYRILIHKLLLINKIIKHRDLASLLKKNLIDLRFHKTILIDMDIVNRLFKYIDRVTSFHHIELNGLAYYETENKWRVYNIKERPSYDVDIPCKESHICERQSIIIPIHGDKIKYMLKYNYNKKNILYCCDDGGYRNLVSQIRSYKLRNVLLVGFDKLTISHDYGRRNKDHRGSNHCNVFLEMYNKVHLKKYATLYDLAIAYYKLKSHKWDKLYEFFGNADTGMYMKDVKVFLNFICE
jgi:hypothetical protein